MAALATPDATLPPPRVRVCGNSFFFDLVLLLFFFETNMVAGGGEEEEEGRSASAANNATRTKPTGKKEQEGACVPAGGRCCSIIRPSVHPEPTPHQRTQQRGWGQARDRAPVLLTVVLLRLILVANE